MNDTVFQDIEEINRLAVQFRLLFPYERALFDKIFKGKTNLNILDIGCNDGSKTYHLFSNNSVLKVIGLEYSSALAKKAQETYGGSVFSFYCCDADSQDFSDHISGIMKENGIERFDVIYISFVLMHLENPQRLLNVLRNFLSPDGCIVSIEANDKASTLKPDEQHLLDEFLGLLDSDPYAGNRNTGSLVPDFLKKGGYGDITIETDLITAGIGEMQKKKDLFETFFSYFPKDLELLLNVERDNVRYHQWSQWLRTKYTTLKSAILNENSEIAMGVRMLTCKRG